MGFMGLVWTVVVGLVVGILARWFYPGPVPMAWWLTALLGIGGSIVGGFIGSLIWKSPDGQFHPAGWILSILGAMLLLWATTHSCEQMAAAARRARRVGQHVPAPRSGVPLSRKPVIDKTVPTPAAALADIHDGATVMIGGFGTAGMPSALIDALIAQGARELTVVNNNAGNADFGLALLLKAKRVRKVICSFPRQVDSWRFDALYRAGEIELELVAQGNLAERIRAAGAGIGAFYTPTGYGTLLAEGKETRVIEGRPCVLEYPIHADFALIAALRADRSGNLVYRKTARNFGPDHGVGGQVHHCRGP